MFETCAAVLDTGYDVAVRVWRHAVHSAGRSRALREVAAGRVMDCLQAVGFAEEAVVAMTWWESGRHCWHSHWKAAEKTSWDSESVATAEVAESSAQAVAREKTAVVSSQATGSHSSAAKSWEDSFAEPAGDMVAVASTAATDAAVLVGIA